MAGRLGRTGKAVLLDALAGERRVRRDSAVDHPDGPAAAEPLRRREGAGDRCQRAAGRLEQMIEVGLQPGRELVQPLEPVFGAHPRRHGERDDPEAERRVTVIGGNAETRAEHALQADGIGVDQGDDTAPHRQAAAVILDRCAVGSDQLLEPQASEFEKRRRARLRDRCC